MPCVGIKELLALTKQLFHYARIQGIILIQFFDFSTLWFGNLSLLENLVVCTSEQLNCFKTNNLNMKFKDSPRTSFQKIEGTTTDNIYMKMVCILLFEMTNNVISTSKIHIIFKHANIHKRTKTSNYNTAVFSWHLHTLFEMSGFSKVKLFVASLAHNSKTLRTFTHFRGHSRPGYIFFTFKIS